MAGQPQQNLVDLQIREAQRRIDEQRAKLQRMIVHGFPTQSAADLLSQLYATLQEILQKKSATR
jgi:hypothetical protein